MTKKNQKIVAKTNLFVVLSEGLLFLGNGATVALEDRFVAEPVESLVTV